MFVGIQCSECSNRLWGSVVSSKHLLLTICDQEVAVFIFLVAKFFHVDAEVHFFVERSQLLIKEIIEAVWVFADGLLGIKVWYTFATNRSSKYILMSVNKCVDSLFS